MRLCILIVTPTRSEYMPPLTVRPTRATSGGVWGCGTSNFEFRQGCAQLVSVGARGCRKRVFCIGEIADWRRLCRRQLKTDHGAARRVLVNVATRTVVGG